MKYDSYILERDIFGHTKHLFYLCGYVKKENACYRIASYSLKTNKLMIKCASEHLPSQEILQDLIKYANKCKYQDVKHLIKEEESWSSK
jgi:hypothetical protein